MAALMHKLAHVHKLAKVATVHKLAKAHQLAEGRARALAVQVCSERNPGMSSWTRSSRRVWRRIQI